MIGKKIKALARDFVGRQVDVRTRVCRMALLVAGVGLLVNGLVYALLLRQGPEVYLLPLCCAAFLLFVAWLSGRVPFGPNTIFAVLLVSNLVMFPLGFFSSGGVESGNPIWMLLGIALVFLTLDGWRRNVLLAISLGAVLAVYGIAALFPDTVIHLNSHLMVQEDSCICLIIASVIIGTAFHFQNVMYRQERQLSEKRRQEIEELMRTQSLFFANMSHEIRTPVSTILGLNELNLREAVSPEVVENSISIQNASKALLALIHDILDLSKLESGKMEIVPARYSTGDMLSELVNMIWVQASAKKLDFKVDVSPEIPSALCGDEMRVKQVLTNLLTNAVKYTEKGSVLLTVKGEPVPEGRFRLKMSVEDTGVGIRKEDLDHLFDVFARARDERTRGIEGTGLGLSISRQLVDRMGGTITVDSIYQKGSCFTVTLEQEIVDAAPLGGLRVNGQRDGRDREPYRPRFEAPGARVLIVDDNEMNRTVARRLLRPTRIQIDTAASGRQCLEKTQTTQYHVILMDHVMREMDGEETLRRVRAQQPGFCQKTPVIALTANVMSSAAQWYQEHGFDGYLAKPVNGALLEAALEKFLPPELVERTGAPSAGDWGAEPAPMVFHNRKKKICVTADSVCDLPAEWCRKYGVRRMYYYIITPQGRFIDTKEISAEELLRYIAEGKTARSSCPSVREYEGFFSDRLMDAEQVIHISAAPGVGEGYRNACQAAECFDNVTVVDSGQFSGGMGLLVLLAAQMAQEGASREEILSALSAAREKVSASFILPSAENLYRSGMVGKGVRGLFRVLNLQPVLGMRRGRLVICGIYSGGMDRAARKYVRRALRRGSRIDDRLLFVACAGCSVKDLERIRGEVTRRKQFREIRFQKTSAAVSSNCETGCFGLSYLRR